MMITIGDNVQVLPPFYFSENVHMVSDVVVAADGKEVYILKDVEGGFSIEYLRKVD